jgi:hypothetical protein
MLSLSDLDFLDQVHRVQLTILIIKLVGAYFLMGIHMSMFVNDLILNACVKTTEMFICEKILTISGYGNQIYFQTIH